MTDMTDEDDIYWWIREEERAEEGRTNPPRRGSREDAEDRGYDPQDGAEGCY